MATDLLILLAGLAALSIGANVLVRGSAAVAAIFKVPTLIIGLTVVAFGTSAPELFVSVNAAISATADMAIGNILGSNIFNILVIIGVSALIGRVKISSSITTREFPIMLATMIIFWIICSNFVVSRTEGILLFVGVIAYIVYNILMAKSGEHTAELDAVELHIFSETFPSRTFTKKVLPYIQLVAGLLGLTYGSSWMVSSATRIAESLGIPDSIVGITILAVGTSLPELATTFAAALKGHPDLAIGNAIGSNIFNVLCVLGLTATVSPLNVKPVLTSIDLPYLLAGCVLTFILMKRKSLLSFWDGLIMIGFYLIYIAYLGWMTYA